MRQLQVGDGLIPPIAAIYIMTIDEKIALMEDRLTKINGRGNKNVKSPGAKKKLVRQLRKMKNEKE